MLLNILLLICSLIVLANSCKNSDQLDGSFQLSVTTDTASASIGDLITYKIITYNIGNKYFEIAWKHLLLTQILRGFLVHFQTQ